MSTRQTVSTRGEQRFSGTPGGSPSRAVHGHRRPAAWAPLLPGPPCPGAELGARGDAARGSVRSHFPEAGGGSAFSARCSGDVGRRNTFLEEELRMF